jgi:hypothetical protein
MAATRPRRGQRANTDYDEQEIRRQLFPLIEALLHPDDASRRANVKSVLPVLQPVTTVLVVDTLIDRLAHKNETFVRVMAPLSLFGDAALARLTSRFKEAQDTALQDGIIDALTAMAPTLDRNQCRALFEESMFLPRFAADIALWQRVRELIGLLAMQLKAQCQEL